MDGAELSKPVRRSLRQSEKLKAKLHSVCTDNDNEKAHHTTVNGSTFYTHHNVSLGDMCPINHNWSLVANKNIASSSASVFIPDDGAKLLCGSEDLNFIPNHLLIPIIEIYDCSIRMRMLLRLAPFRFEDFCFCLIHQGQSPLLAEIFLAYLRVLFIDDENNGVTYFTPNEKDSAYIFNNTIDDFTWVEAVKVYFSSSNSLLPLYKSIVNKAGFPMSSSIDDKVCLLKALHSNFIDSIIFSTYLADVSIFQMSDKFCKSCKKPGNLEFCCLCPNAYHKDCLVNVRYEQKQLICSLCCEHSVNGLNYDDLFYRYNRVEHSLKPIGVDICGRLYWFTVRRIFVEDSSGKIRYYSSVAAVEKLLSYLSCFADDTYSQQIVDFIHKYVLKEVGRNSAIAKSECFSNYTPIYELDSVDISSSIVVDKSTSVVSLKNSRFYFIGMNDGYLRYCNYYNQCTSECSALWHPNLSKKVYNSQMLYHNLSWHGGFDQLYKDVVDLRKCNGASYRVVHEFAFLKLIQNALISLESLLPSPYLNPIWYHQLPAWAKCVRMASSPAKLAALILLFYHMIKPFTFQSSWFESTGHLLPCKIVCPDTKLEKSLKAKPIPTLVRNFQTYVLTKEYNDFDELINVDVVVESSLPQFKPYASPYHKQTTSNINTSFVKFKKPPQHRVWNQKGEEYRLSGEGSWYLVNATNISGTLEKLIQKPGALDNLIENIFTKSSSPCSATTNSVVPMSTLDTQMNVLPSLAPVNSPNNILKAVEPNEYSSASFSSTNVIDYAPGEAVSKFFIRKGSALLKSIEKGLMSSRKPLVTMPEKLMTRELKDFVNSRQVVSNMCDVLRVYRICAEERFRLGRKAGLCEVNGFNYNNSSYRSSNSQNWPICFPRPSIGRIWEIRMLTVTSIFDIAFLLKVFYTCLDLGNLNNSSSDNKGADEIVVGGINLQTTPIYCSQVNESIITEEILDAKSISSDGLIYAYFVKRTVQPLSKLVSNANYYLVDNKNFILNKDGEIDIVSKSKIEPVSNGDDGRYVSSFRKNSVPPEHLVNDHVLRSSSSSSSFQNNRVNSKLVYKHSATVWMHEKEVNTILIKRFWAKVEEERTRLQTEYTSLHKKWLHLATNKTNFTLPLTSNPPFKFQADSIKCIDGDVPSAANSTPPSLNHNTFQKPIKQDENLIIPLKSPATPFSSGSRPSLNNISQPPKVAVKPTAVTSTVSTNFSTRKKPQEFQTTFDMSYENMVIYQQVKEEKLRLKPKVDTMFCFKVQELLNVHAEYVKTNLRRNKKLSDNSPTSQYLSYIDIKEKLDQLYSHEDFIIGKFLKSTNKCKNSSDNLNIPLFQSSTYDTHFRRSNRAHKPKVPYEEFDYSDNPEKSIKTNLINKQHSRTSCCCSSLVVSTDRTFVSCCGCGNVFHGVCYGMSKLKASVVSRFYCPSCDLARDDSYLVGSKSINPVSDAFMCSCGNSCVIPDQSNSLSDVQTVKCQLCFSIHHATCINFPNENPALYSYFICNQCKNNLLERVVSDHCSPLSLVGRRVFNNLVAQLKLFDVSSPFLYPVDLSVVTDYDTVVKNPMDLSTLESGLHSHKYCNVADFVRDMMLIFTNCRLYNSRETIYVKYANCLESIFLIKLHSLIQRSDICTWNATKF